MLPCPRPHEIAWFSMLDIFARGGAPVWGILCFAFVTHPLAIAAAVIAFTQRRRGLSIGLGGASVVFGLGTVLVGVGGYLWGMQRVEAAIAFADASSRDALYAMGQSEALLSVWCALAACALPLLTGALAVARGMSLPKEGR